MPLESFIPPAEGRPLTLAVVNRDVPLPVQSMLENLFDEQPIDVTERQLPDGERDVVYLIDEGEVIATSSLESLMDSILLVNSDLYTTGARTPSEVVLPDVIEALEDVRFRLHGYPESNSETLLLTTISRYIERLALESTGGKHRASFQRLSRIDDEIGTRYVYERLAESPVDTHVYGIPDWTPPPEFDVTMHGGWKEAFQQSWFVSFVPESDADEHAALVAQETEPRVYEGFWTFDAERIAEINRYIEREL